MVRLWRHPCVIVRLSSGGSCELPEQSLLCSLSTRAEAQEVTCMRWLQDQASQQANTWIIGDVCAWDHIHSYQCLVCGSAIITSRPFWSHSSCVLFLWIYNVSHHHAKFVIELVWLFIFTSKSWKPALAPWKDVEDLSHMRTVLEILC